MTDLLDQKMRKEFEQWLEVRRAKTRAMIEDMKRRTRMLNR
jgi:hypothetical protein